GMGVGMEPPGMTAEDLSHRRCSFTPWTTVDDLVSPLSATGSASPSSVTADPFNNIYVSGATSDGSVGAANHWIIRKSSNAGLTWSVVDDFQLTSGASSTPSAIIADANGNVFASGTGALASGSRWLTRRSTDAGATWSNVDTFVESNGHVGIATGATVDPSGTLFVSASAHTLHPPRQPTHPSVPPP